MKKSTAIVTRLNARPVGPPGAAASRFGLLKHAGLVFGAANALQAALFLIASNLCVEAQIRESHSFLELNRNISDGNAAGLSDVRLVTSAVVNVSSVQVKLYVAGDFNGDLYGYVRHVSANCTNFCVVLNPELLTYSQQEHCGFTSEMRHVY